MYLVKSSYWSTDRTFRPGGLFSSLAGTNSRTAKESPQAGTQRCPTIMLGLYE